MRIVDIREKAFPVQVQIRNAAFDFSQMTTSVVAVVTDVRRQGRPVVGFAFNSTGRYACGGAMRGRFIPRLLAAPPESLLDDSGVTLDGEKALRLMMVGEKPGGHSERSIPIGTIETAVWDAAAKILDQPLWALLADRYNGGKHPERIACYVGGGWYHPGGTSQDLKDEIARYRAAGYRMVKIKIGGAPLADDLKRVEAALSVLDGGGNLAVDANAGLSPRAAHDYAKALGPYELRWFEEPLDPLDLAGFSELAAIYAPPLATGENLFSVQDVDNLLRLGGFRSGHDVLQVDPPQAYGLAAYAGLVRHIETLGHDRACLYPHGGNLMSFAAVAGLGLGGCEAYPGVFGAFGGYADDMRVEDGWMELPDRPGIGFEGHAEFHALARKLVEDFSG